MPRKEERRGMPSQNEQSASTVMSHVSREDLETILSRIDLNYERDPITRRLYEDGRRTQPHLPKLAMKWFEDIVSRAPLADELWFSKRRPREEDRYGATDYLYHEDTLKT